MNRSCVQRLRWRYSPALVTPQRDVQCTIGLRIDFGTVPIRAGL